MLQNVKNTLQVEEHGKTLTLISSVLVPSPDAPRHQQQTQVHVPDNTGMVVHALGIVEEQMVENTQPHTVSIDASI